MNQIIILLIISDTLYVCLPLLGESWGFKLHMKLWDGQVVIKQYDL